MKKKVLMLFVINLLLSSCSETQVKPVVFESQLEATATPKLFMPGMVTKRGLRHFGSSFSGDGSKLVYTISDGKKPSKVVVQNFINGKFSNPLEIINDTLHSFADASVSLDGNTVTLTSTLPQNGGLDDNSKNGIWQFNKSPHGWSAPKFIELKMDYDGGFGYPTTTANKDLYFAYIPADGSRNMDIFYAKFNKGNYDKPVKLSSHINTDKFEGDPFIDSHERFLIFAGFGEENNYGKSDLYISFRTQNGWSNAINLGENINSHGFDSSPYVTSDDKYLIFTSSRHPDNPGQEEFFNVFYVSFELDKYKALIDE
jgi:Tol biopolymer transport system component